MQDVSTFFWKNCRKPMPKSIYFWMKQIMTVSKLRKIYHFPLLTNICMCISPLLPRRYAVRGSSRVALTTGIIRTVNLCTSLFLPDFFWSRKMQEGLRLFDGSRGRSSRIQPGPRPAEWPDSPVPTDKPRFEEIHLYTPREMPVIERGHELSAFLPRVEPRGPTSTPRAALGRSERSIRYVQGSPIVYGEPGRAVQPERSEPSDRSEAIEEIRRQLELQRQVPSYWRQQSIPSQQSQQIQQSQQSQHSIPRQQIQQSQQKRFQDPVTSTVIEYCYPAYDKYVKLTYFTPQSDAYCCCSHCQLKKKRTQKKTLLDIKVPPGKEREYLRRARYLQAKLQINI